MVGNGSTERFSLCREKDIVQLNEAKQYTRLCMPPGSSPTRFVRQAPNGAHVRDGWQGGGGNDLHLTFLGDIDTMTEHSAHWIKSWGLGFVGGGGTDETSDAGHKAKLGYGKGGRSPFNEMGV
jgi:hypothetical protein